MIQAILHAVQDAVFVADIRTGMILDANPAAESLCGRRVAELRSMHYSRLYPPEAVETAKNAFQDDPHCPGLWESAIVHKDGHAIPVEISASRYVTVDGRQVLVGVFRDTTERNAARDALRQSEERFRQVAESAGEFIWETDTEGLYTYCMSAKACCTR